MLEEAGIFSGQYGSHQMRRDAFIGNPRLSSHWRLTAGARFIFALPHQSRDGWIVRLVPQDAQDNGAVVEQDGDESGDENSLNPSAPAGAGWRRCRLWWRDPCHGERLLDDLNDLLECRAVGNFQQLKQSHLGARQDRASLFDSLNAEGAIVGCA